MHADSANFDAASTKTEVYAHILDSTHALLHDQRNWVAGLANTASLLWHGLKSLPAPSSKVNWAGFYVVDRLDRGQLILGPFHGKVACQVIKIGKGVCGRAAETAETQLVRNVHDFADHIACDSETNRCDFLLPKLGKKKSIDKCSEIVVPIVRDGTVVGVIDIDCEELEGFDEVDQKYLEQLAQVLAVSLDWD